MKPTYIIKEFKLGRDRIYIFAYPDKKAKVRTIILQTRKVTGKFSIANRITSGNGKIVHDQQGFNSVQSAVKNLTATKNVLGKWAS